MISPNESMTLSDIFKWLGGSFMKQIFLASLFFISSCAVHNHYYNSKGDPGQSYHQSAAAKSSKGDYQKHHQKYCKNKRHAVVCPRCSDP